jgi:hypothetical protein
LIQRKAVSLSYYRCMNRRMLLLCDHGVTIIMLILLSVLRVIGTASANGLDASVVYQENCTNHLLLLS